MDPLFQAGSPGHVDEHNRLLSGAVSPELFGAKGDGVSDDTSAVQAAVSSVTSTPRASATLALFGRYKVTTPITIEDVMGFQLLGTAGSALVAGADMSAVLILNGVAYSRFGGFEIVGTGGATVERGIHLYWDAATASRSTTLNRFHDIDIHSLNYVTGIELGRTGDGNQVDNTTLRNISIVGNWENGDSALWQHGLVVGDGIHGNNLIHNAYGLVVGHNRYNVDVRSTQFGLFGGGFDGGEVDLRLGGAGYLTVQGIRSENTQRLLETGGPAGFPSVASLRDVTWRAEDIAADGEFVRWYYGGSLRLENVQVASAGAAPKIAFGGYAPTRALVEGLILAGGPHVPVTVADLFSVSNSNATISARAITRTDEAGNAIESIDYDSAT